MRMTRSMTSKEAPTSNHPPSRLTTANVSAMKTAHWQAKEKVQKRTSKPSSSTSKDVFRISKLTTATPAKRKRDLPIQEVDINELPHNLGKSSTNLSDSLSTIKFEAEVKPQPIHIKTGGQTKSLGGQTTNTSKNSKGRKGAAQYGLSPGVSPFPDHAHPTADECEEVNRLLSSLHGEVKVPTTIPQPSLTVTGCGEVPSVLDALIRTLLSGATTGANSARSFQGLVQRFGILESGIGKGSVNWNAVREAPIDEVFQAMKSGGLATTKSRYIKQILNMVYEENQARREAHINSEKGTEETGPVGAVHESKAQKEVEIALIDENVLSLDWVHALDKEQAMLELIKYPGIGPKTAACVILFCLQRPCFAVDTHIFRICKWLGWLPSSGKRVSEINAFSHLEVRVPDHLKYSLHQLLIRHGKSCPRCRAITGEKSDGWEKGCVIDHLVTRTGKRKGGVAKDDSSELLSTDED